MREQGLALNYKPAMKRALRSRLQENSDAILALNGHDIAQIFDEPALVRRDMPTTIWQYRNDECVLDVYFTSGESGDVSQADVVHYEMRDRQASGKKPKASSCLGSLASNDSVLSLINVDAFYKVSE